MKCLRRREATLVESGGGRAVLHVISACLRGAQRETACQVHIHLSPVKCGLKNSRVIQEVLSSSPKLRELITVTQNKSTEIALDHFTFG